MNHHSSPTTPLTEALDALCAEARARVRTTQATAWRKRHPESGDASDRLCALDAAVHVLGTILLATHAGREAKLRPAFTWTTARALLQRISPGSAADPDIEWFAPGPRGEAAALAAASDPAANLEGLATLYLDRLGLEHRREFGKFYTPASIVGYILDQAGYRPGPGILTRRLIDPSCGAGAFLVEAGRRFLASAKAARWPAHKRMKGLESAAVGCDIDPTAVRLTRLRLIQEVLPLAGPALRMTFDPAVRCSDPVQAFRLETQATLDLDGPPPPSTLSLHEFDFVVGNPPYGKISEMLPALRLAFAASLYGHPNLYGIFIHLGLYLLKAGGTLGYIVPKSFSSGLYFKNLRQLLVTRTDLQELLTLQERQGTFTDVLQETLILLASAKSGERHRTILVAEAHGTNGSLEKDSVAVVPAESVVLGPQYHHVFCLSSDTRSYAVKEKLFKRGCPLSQLGIRVSTGQLVWNRRKSYLLAAPARGAAPMLWGHHVRAFAFLPERHYADRPEWVRVAGQTTGEICQPRERILVKRMTAKEELRRLVAARVPASFGRETEGYFLENHLNFLEFPAEPGWGELLLGFLNSRVAEFLFRMINGNTQVSATELSLLPLAAPSDRRAITAAVRALEKSRGEDREAFAALQEEFYRLYGLTAAERAHVEMHCPGGAAQAMVEADATVATASG